MKKIIVLASLIAVALTGHAQKQTDATICHTPATEKFALFASNKSFNMNHPSPVGYVHVSTAGGKMIRIKTVGVEANAFVLEAKQKTNNWIFVFQEWWGLNDHIKREAENLYNDLGSVNVMALTCMTAKWEPQLKKPASI